MAEVLNQCVFLIYLINLTEWWNTLRNNYPLFIPSFILMFLPALLPSSLPTSLPSIFLPPCPFLPSLLSCVMVAVSDNPLAAGGGQLKFGIVRDSKL